MRSHQSEVVLSAGMTLQPEWQEIHPSEEMRTTAAWSELLLETPGLRLNDDTQLLLADGTSIDVEGYLTTVGSERIDLGRATAVGYGGRTFLRLSTAALEWKRQDYRIRSVSLKSAKPLKVGRIIWMSYDPQDTKSGVEFPRSLK
jgi:hypothetical protein